MLCNDLLITNNMISHLSQFPAFVIECGKFLKPMLDIQVYAAGNDAIITEWLLQNFRKTLFLGPLTQNLGRFYGFFMAKSNSGRFYGL